MCPPYFGVRQMIWIRYPSNWMLSAFWNGPLVPLP
jgi:hypothetical protein